MSRTRYVQTPNISIYYLQHLAVFSLGLHFFISKIGTMKTAVSPHSSMCVLSRFSSVQLWATLWTKAFQAPLSMGFPRQEYWSGLPCAPPGDLPSPEMEPALSYVSSLVGGFFTPGPTCLCTPNKFFGAKDRGRGLAHRKWFTFVMGFCTALWVSPAP